MLVEARRAARNERGQLANGGMEPPGDVYDAMRVVYPLAFVAMLLEGAILGPASWPAAVAGWTVFAAGKALKWWAIVTLGRFWTFRVIVLPGAPLVAGGPYRWLRHPNYVGVVGELAGVAIANAALRAGIASLVVFGILLARRIAVEDRALDEARQRSPTS